ncbi:TolB amino-terminal domain-containing protein [Rhizobiales bacterium GAS191]|nr:TolB amino-terminal domain-containing protein [Rhizobiales bacterium GAS113]SEE90923.1 TolB amino-terminal domain-containing protein [Rhizobiales bacterium GAS191]
MARRGGFRQSGISVVQTAQHRLVAILAADVVGYTRLMEAQEEYTHISLMRLRLEVLEPGIAADHGHVVKNTGDGFLAIFDSARDAAQCAVALQKAVATRTAKEPPNRRISFRMAVNLSDIIVEEGDIYGDGVNITSRLQAFAEPGGIVVSSAVAQQIGRSLDVGTIDLGSLHLRNLSRPIQAFALHLPGAQPRLVGDLPGGSDARPSIAVLPFRELQGQPEEGYFADGIVDDIIHALAALKELFVISRGSTLAYRNGAFDVRAIGKDLGVRYVLHGSVRRSGGRLRIVTELSDTESGDVISSEQYEGTLADLFELQDQISVHVVKTIAPHVRERELTRSIRKHPQDMTAYDLVLQALDFLYRMDQESFSHARTLLQQAISHDPSYAPAHSYTAYWYVLRVGEIGSSDPEVDAAAGARHAAAAIERNEYDALALAIYGHVQSYLLKDYERARLYLDRAIAAGPSSAMAWTMSSATHGFVCDAVTAIKHGEQGVRLSPLDAHTFWHEGILAQAHYVAGDNEQALVWARRAVGRNESIRFTTRTLIASLAALGKTEEAAQAAQHLLRLQPDFRLGPYGKRCPFREPVLGKWLAGLRSAGLPE